MKSFAAFVLLAASAATAQTPPVTYNSTTGVFTCPASHPNGAYCAGTSLETNIIIRCTNGIGTPGNCNDNLAGEPPSGVWYAPCWETSPTSGDAACSKNCIVYAANGTFTAPGCIPISSTTSASSSSTSSPASSSTPTTSVTTSTTSVGSSSVSASSSASSASSTTVYTTLSTTTYCPSSTLSSVIVHSSSSKCVTSASSAPSSSIILSTGTGSSSPSSNHTSATGGAGGTSSGGSSATATPVGPTATNTPVLTTSGAIANSGSILAAVGLFIAYFL